MPHDTRTRVVAALRAVEDFPKAWAVAAVLYALSEVGESEEGGSDKEGLAAMYPPLGREGTVRRSGVAQEVTGKELGRLESARLAPGKLENRGEDNGSRYSLA